MFLESLHLRNFLSFGPDAEPVELRKLNVLIGVNGSGKSNFLEALALLQAAPSDVARPIIRGGGVSDWLWKAPGGKGGTISASLDAVISNPKGSQSLRYLIAFGESGGRFYFEDERIENQKAVVGQSKPYFFYHFDSGHPTLNVREDIRHLKREDMKPELSILAQRRDPDAYPEITYLSDELSKIQLYREWTFGRDSTPRLPQSPGAPTDKPEPDLSNLGLVLNNLEPLAKKSVANALRNLYEGIDGFEVRIVGANAQIFLSEQDRLIPATRLSDGTLRVLALLAILYQRTVPPLIGIEEPELGIHPDVLPILADLLKEASERTQLVVTTHSPILVDALNDTPESVLVCERDDEGTQLQRLDDLKPWLERYALGQLWMRGDLGGTRW